VSPVAFLVAALVASAMGVATLALRRREPNGLHDTVKAFEREMQALDPNRRARHEPSRFDEPTEPRG
jgi:hypothetical protein